ncbi:hypothetical protein [Pseudomonas putida]|uniref:TniQ protein n=1 Tax=Pseudomonas putida ND6 TaxID=231023 RepID=I3UVF8_PSEPU|nr:hypothetical protein [Pseudomonas putida]AFK69479.1 hypothetical protein YSA_05017 [Pseudomonas putida ND6]
MLLAIQPHESLRSFIERHFYLAPRSPESIKLKEISRYYMRGQSIGIIADLLGMSDTYGFNRLLHEHTSYSQVGVFPDFDQRSYTRKIYKDCYTRFETECQLAGICIDCVKEDFDSLGFPYWRRDHRYVEVCAKHNTILLRQCPVCGRDIRYHGQGYGHDLLWTGCKGRYIHHCESRKNTSKYKLTFAKIFAEIGESHFAVDLESAIAQLAGKATKIAMERLITEEQLIAINWKLERFRGISDTSLDYRPDGRYSQSIIEVIALLYGSFAALIYSLRDTDNILQSVDDLMRIEYREAPRYYSSSLSPK